MKSKRSWLSAGAGILALVMVITMLAGIGPADAATSDELKNQLDDLQERKDQIAQQIQDLESQLIGYVGNTGLSKGAHLHFGISYKGQYVNPMDHLG